MNGEMTVLDGNVDGEVNDSTVALATYDGDFGDFSSFGLDLDYLEEFVEFCRSMDWDEVDVHFKDKSPVFAHERHEDHGTYVVLAPKFPDEVLEEIRDD